MRTYNAVCIPNEANRKLELALLVYRGKGRGGRIVAVLIYTRIRGRATGIIFS